MERQAWKLIVLLLLFCYVHSPYVEAQVDNGKQITMEFKNEGLPSIFKRLQKLSGYKVLFIYDEVRSYHSTGKVEKVSVEEALKVIIGKHPLKYAIEGQFINITNKNPQKVIPEVKGRIIADEDGLPVIGATIQVEGTSIRTITDANGNFRIANVPYGNRIKISYVGMQAQSLSPKAQMSVILKTDTKALDEVVVEAGIIQRNKMGFTGSYRTVNQEELKAVGNINVLQSLKTLDPSFVVADDMSMGSDPNTMSKITMRGGTTMTISGIYDDTTTNPNEPLFILDGFESTLQEINDLDINRIESITLLKDAASTAIYGSKGANGVVVVETIKPKAGEVMINYSGDAQVAWADLSVYNMMNAAEKLEFEVLAGRYGDLNDWSGNKESIAQYHRAMENVKRGVDTYWLKVPVQTAITQSHSLNVSGGDKGFLYQIGAMFKDIQGVMKGSARQTFGGNMRMTYRKNKFNISNNLNVNVTNGNNGAWGSFSEFVNANPYYPMINEDGTISRDLDVYIRPNYTDVVATNPYYNAMLPSEDRSKILSVTNNTNLNWYIIDNLRWTASMSLGTTNTDNMNFTDPAHTKYATSDYTKQGEYSSSKTRSWRYIMNTGVAYALSLKEHNLTFNGRAEIRSTSSNTESFVATGFPKGVGPIPSFAYSFKENSTPGYNESISRGVSFLGTFNYNYKYRYLFDASISSDGSTSFGRDKKFQTFWSVGAGWNVSKEAFAKDWDWMQELKLRGSFGSNGNQNVSNLTSNVYSYYAGSDIFGTASYLSGYANPNLEWQVVKKTSVGVDLMFWENRLLLTMDYYHTNTNPLVVSIQQKPSSGLSSLPINLGHLNTNGFEFNVSWYAIKNLEKRIMLNFRLNGNTYKSVYGGFGAALANLNDAYKKDSSVDSKLNVNSMIQYQDGESPSALFAVRSLGIDPATGKEVFLTKNGTPTFDYNADDRVKIADTNPKIRGVFGISFTYKNLQASVNLRYNFGSYAFNSALFNKVENISASNIAHNQDKRALYSRWKNAGDVSQFKGISLSKTTPISSRFVQRDNYLRGESARLSWDFSRDEWIKRLFLKDLRFNVSFNDFFDLSEMKRERGTDYPFQRAVSFGLSARF
ncbi:TonB-dependent receptor [Bacteroides sp. f07]|uniref:SusC/RagA family TonB-linked outer membrane protein n=1 Tax=Bacteroides sp. f07 TaxID=3132704 RepID=UPI0034A7261B